MPTEEIERLGKRILERLEILEISQAEAARRAGVAPSWLSDLLKGRKNSVQSHNLARMAQALLTTPSFLLGETVDPMPSGVYSPNELAELIPKMLAAPPLMRRTTAETRLRPLRHTTPKIMQSFISIEMQRTFQKHWDDTLGKDTRPRIPLFSEPASGQVGAVVAGSGLPPPTLSLPVLAGSIGSYAIAMPDGSMMPAIENDWLVYAKPSILFTNGIAVLRVLDPDQGAIFLVRIIRRKLDDVIEVGTLNDDAIERIPFSQLRSIHPVFGMGRDPILYGPDGDLAPEDEDWPFDN